MLLDRLNVVKLIMWNSRLTQTSYRVLALSINPDIPEIRLDSRGTHQKVSTIQFLEQEVELAP